MKHIHQLIKLICILFTSLLIIGCGGGNDNGESFEGLEVVLAPGKITGENSGTKDLLFASVRGTGIAGGRVEDNNGKELGDLVPINQTGAYEFVQELPEGGFIGGQYTLIYHQNADTFEKKKTLTWGTLQPFTPAPTTPDWDSNTKRLTLNYSLLPAGGTVNYHLRLYSDLSDNLIRQSPKIQGPMIVEHVPSARKYRILLVAEVLENNEVVSTIRHVFSTRDLN